MALIVLSSVKCVCVCVHSMRYKILNSIHILSTLVMAWSLTNEYRMTYQLLKIIHTKVQFFGSRYFFSSSVSCGNTEHCFRFWVGAVGIPSCIGVKGWKSLGGMYGRMCRKKWRKSSWLRVSSWRHANVRTRSVGGFHFYSVSGLKNRKIAANEPIRKFLKMKMKGKWLMILPKSWDGRQVA